MSSECEWKLGDVAIARIGLNAYAKVRVVKDENGFISKDQVLGVAGGRWVRARCVHAEVSRARAALWLPAAGARMRIAQRARPFYGKPDPVPRPAKKKKVKVRRGSRPVIQLTEVQQALFNAIFKRKKPKTKKKSKEAKSDSELRGFALRGREYEPEFKGFIQGFNRDLKFKVFKRKADFEPDFRGFAEGDDNNITYARSAEAESEGTETEGFIIEHKNDGGEYGSEAGSGNGDDEEAESGDEYYSITSGSETSDMWETLSERSNDDAHSEEGYEWEDAEDEGRNGKKKKKAKGNKAEKEGTFEKFLRDANCETEYGSFMRRGRERAYDSLERMKPVAGNDEGPLCAFVREAAAGSANLPGLLKSSALSMEIEHYVQSLWRYRRPVANDGAVLLQKERAAVHTGWCAVCGERGGLRVCRSCPAAFHDDCRDRWLPALAYRNLLVPDPVPTLRVERILSSTRARCSMPPPPSEPSPDLCAACLWGPSIGFGDIVWHKLGACGWWPARILCPGDEPACLRTARRPANPSTFALRYYGTRNHAWGEESRMCLFLPTHTHALAKNGPLRDAVMDAADDYVATYLK